LSKIRGASPATGYLFIVGRVHLAAIGMRHRIKYQFRPDA
jgi:hypothetical protein